jgi:hypothetical protein
MTFKKIKNLTLDILKFVVDEPRNVKITGPIHLGKAQKKGKGDDDTKEREPAHLASCINLDDGSECQIIVSAVALSVLTDDYPNDSYVGKCFEITKKKRVEGKQYFPYGVIEIEDPAITKAAEEAKAAAAAKAAEDAKAEDLAKPADTAKPAETSKHHGARR